MTNDETKQDVCNYADFQGRVLYYVLDKAQHGTPNIWGFGEGMQPTIDLALFYTRKDAERYRTYVIDNHGGAIDAEIREVFMPCLLP